MEIYGIQLVVFVMILIRVLSAVILAPAIGDQIVPTEIKVAIAIFISLTLYPVVAAENPKVDLALGGLVLMGLKEAAMGLTLGFTSGLVLLAGSVAGDIMSFDLGLSMAVVLDPETGAQNNVISEFIRLVMVLLFLVLNGHHFVLQALKMSFECVGLGGFTVTQAVADRLLPLTGVVMVLGIKLAAPIIVASFLVNAALGILTRVAPQVNVFMLNFQLKLGVGFIVLMTAAPMMVFVFKKALAGFEENMVELVRTF
jgi:flagellar biosynthetic protein FliR